jgi:hypothetical protein
MRYFRRLVLLAIIAPLGACGSTSTPSGPADPASGVLPDASTTAYAAVDAGGGGNEAATNNDTGAPSGGDQDGDGIDDALEATYAETYMPYVSVHPNDGCKTHGLLYRVSPHPTEPKRVMMWVDVLYNDDCGLASGHIGDDEEFSVVIDPSRPPPEGILAVRGISHEGTPCEHKTTCGRCSGMTACSTTQVAGQPIPVDYPSKDKHGNYVDMGTCSTSMLCDFGGCALTPTPDTTLRINAGEPNHPLVHDLTAAGLVTSANGWTHPELMNFDPWKPGIFGGAGDISKDLVDTSYVIDTTKCP